MSRLPQIEANAAKAGAAELMAGVQAALGVTPNMVKAMANSPAALKAWVQFNGTVGEGTLSGDVRERIALLVAEENGCDYCLSVHSYLGANVAKLSDTEIGHARNGQSDTPKAAAILSLAAAIVRTRGDVEHTDLTAARNAGITDEEIAEVVANVALNFYTNFFNRLAHTEIDFPVVRHEKHDAKAEPKTPRSFRS
jgi:uncharacterized peroxidase-related enzyme